MTHRARPSSGSQINGYHITTWHRTYTELWINTHCVEHTRPSTTDIVYLSQKESGVFLNPEVVATYVQCVCRHL